MIQFLLFMSSSKSTSSKALWYIAKTLTVNSYGINVALRSILNVTFKVNFTIVLGFNLRIVDWSRYTNGKSFKKANLNLQ